MVSQQALNEIRADIASLQRTVNNACMILLNRLASLEAMEQESKSESKKPERN